MIPWPWIPLFFCTSWSLSHAHIVGRFVLGEKNTSSLQNETKLLSPPSGSEKTPGGRFKNSRILWNIVRFTMQLVLQGFECNRCSLISKGAVRCTAGLTSYLQRKNLTFPISPRPELWLMCRERGGGLMWDKVWHGYCQAIETMPVVSTDFGAQGDNKEWHPTCANGFYSSNGLTSWHHCSRQKHVTAVLF